MRDMVEDRKNNGMNTGNRFKKGDPRPKGAGRRRGQRNTLTMALKIALSPLQSAPAN